MNGFKFSKESELQKALRQEDFLIDKLYEAQESQDDKGYREAQKLYSEKLKESEKFTIERIKEEMEYVAGLREKIITRCVEILKNEVSTINRKQVYDKLQCKLHEVLIRYSVLEEALNEY